MLWEVPEQDDVSDSAAQQGIRAWIAGGAGAVRKIRRHLVGACALSRCEVAFMGYWRIGSSEDNRPFSCVRDREPYRGRMGPSLYCIEHAMAEKLVVATSISDGRSACGHHSSAEPTPIGQHPSMDQCQWCTAVPHRAYFIVDGRSACIRHAADVVFPLDDMGAHHMAHTAYLRLRDSGVSDAY